MRTLRIVVTRSKGVLPVLALATLLPAAAATCGSTVIPEMTSGSVSGTGGASSSSAGGGGQGGGIILASSSSGQGGAPGCSNGGTPVSFTVAVPPDGVPASPGSICAVMMGPVESNHSARVTLTKSPMSLEMAKGMVTIDPALGQSIIGTPKIEVVQAASPDFLTMQVSNIQPVAGGFSFDAQWPQPLPPNTNQWSEMQVKTTLTVACDPMAMDTRIVESYTYIHLCLGDADLTWVSSGDVCNSCDIIAEMAPSPIVPDAGADDLPLARVIRLRITVLARVGNTLVLLAENDGGEALSYNWHPSGGTVEELASDIVVWTPPKSPGPHLIQAAIEGEDGAAVASFTFQEAQ